MLRAASRRALIVASALRRTARERVRSRRAWKGLLRDAERTTWACLDVVPENGDTDRALREVREQFLWMLGIDTSARRDRPSFEVTRVSDESGYRLERLVFESLPGLKVTSNLYIPSNGPGPWPCVVYLCGHMPSRDGAKAGFQERYLWYPRNGFACLVVDPVGYGEIPGLHRGTHDLSMWSWFSMGYTPAGIEVWNGIRALDLLEARSEIDPDRIGVTGISGGGVMTWYLAAADSRVRVAVPSCSTYSVGQQASGRLVREQCDCVFLPNVFGVDLPTIAALIAPRPIVMMGGRRDPIFPPSGFRLTYRMAREAYRRRGGEAMAERVKLVEAPSGHDDPPAFLSSAREAMVRWLAPKPSSCLGEFAGTAEAPRQGRELRCLESLPRNALNYSIHESFAPGSREALDWREGGWPARRSALLSELKRTVFRWLPKSPSLPQARRVHESAYYAGRFAEFEAWELEPEAGIGVRVLALRAGSPRPAGASLLVVRGREEGWQYPDLEPLLPFLGVRDTYILYPRFSDTPMTPARYAEVERTAALSGRTIAALQVWDTMQTALWLAQGRKGCGAGLCVVGREGAAIAALYSSILSDHISGTVLWDPPASHRSGPPLLTVLRTTDLWETAALVAPRPLGFVGKPNREFARTREVLSGVGQAESLGEGRSLFEAVSWAMERMERMERDSRDDDQGVGVAG